MTSDPLLLSKWLFSDFLEFLGQQVQKEMEYEDWDTALKDMNRMLTVLFAVLLELHLVTTSSTLQHLCSHIGKSSGFAYICGRLVPSWCPVR